MEATYPYAIKNQLKAPKAGFLWHKDRWLPCMERIYYRRPYATEQSHISQKRGILV